MDPRCAVLAFAMLRRVFPLAFSFRLTLLASCTLSVLGSSLPARAQPAWELEEPAAAEPDPEPAPDPTPAPELAPGPRIGDDDDGDRLGRLEAILEEDQTSTRSWWRTWMYIQGGLFVGQLAWAGLTYSDTEERNVRLIGATGPALNMLTLLILKPPAMSAYDKLRALPSDTEEQRQYKQQQAEELLTKSAKVQAFGTGWAPYAGALLYGIATGIPLWNYDRKLAAAGNVLGSLGLTAFQVVTTPTGALDEVERSSRPKLRPTLAWSQSRLTLQMQLVGTW